MSVRTQVPAPGGAAHHGREARRLVMPLFLGLTLVVSWGGVLHTDGMLLPYGPLLAAVVVVGVWEGRKAARDLLRGLVVWRVGMRWYVVAVGLVVSAHAVALMVASAMDVVEVPPLDLTWSAALAIIIPLVVAGGQWEEPGWLAFLLASLQRHRTWTPWLVLALASFVRISWHLPLLAYGTIPWYDFIFGIAALQVLLTWLYNATGGSLLLPMLCHLTSNVALALVRANLDNADHEAYWAVYTAAVSVVAISVLAGTRGRLGWPAGSPSCDAGATSVGRIRGGQR
jgi:hypothetical protein